jgi:RluA family pseudouridine synthase
MELVEFGALWLDNHVSADAQRIIDDAISFKIVVPSYKPQTYYNIDPGRIVFQDRDLVIYDKEAGPPTQPVPHDSINNLQYALEMATRMTLWCPHRIDAATSGLVIMAANRLASGRMGTAFQKGWVKKRYLALSSGPKPNFEKTTVTATISKVAGRYQASDGGPGYASETVVTVLGDYGNNTLFLCEPLTGRTHQIRLHLAYLGNPIVGDLLYGTEPADRMMLRASGLSFKHPGNGKMVVLGGPWPKAGPEWKGK